MNKVVVTKIRKHQRYPILVVESDPNQWLTLRSALAQCFPEIEPIWKNHTFQALEYLKTASTNSKTIPRLIFLNPFAPSQQEGWELLVQIKNDPFCKRIPIIAFSHSVTGEDILKAYSLGVAAYINKPSSYRQLLLDVYTIRKYWWETVTLPII